ncbi:MAG TPA: hypothetical protein VD793_04390, partial [Gemmatimonadales bacterium]|nr:hypothetical protein [Gemmatimonadales bacterium]
MPAPLLRPFAIGALVLHLALAGACSSGTPVSSPAPAAISAAVYPATSWERIADPVSAGWTQASLDSVRARLSTMHTTGFMAVVGGRVLMEYGDVQAVSYLASVRKSVLSMLFGTYV